MDSKYKIDQKVDLVILKQTNLGFIAKINGQDKGLLYHGEIFKPLSEGQALQGYIKKIRPDGNIDLMLEPTGFQGSDDLGRRILEALEQNNGFLPINSKTHAETIYEKFGVSRNKFKLALARLYKNRLITFTDTGTELCK